MMVLEAGPERGRLFSCQLLCEKRGIPNDQSHTAVNSLLVLRVIGYKSFIINMIYRKIRQSIAFLLGGKVRDRG